VLLLVDGGSNDMVLCSHTFTLAFLSRNRTPNIITIIITITTAVIAVGTTTDRLKHCPLLFSAIRPSQQSDIDRVACPTNIPTYAHVKYRSMNRLSFDSRHTVPPLANPVHTSLTSCVGSAYSYAWAAARQSIGARGMKQVV
jgi:hypothetical protein